MIEGFKIDRNCGERVEAEMGRNRISLTCASDWSGDTETGFGEHVTQHMNFDEVEQLRDWLTAAMKHWIGA